MKFFRKKNPIIKIFAVVDTACINENNKLLSNAHFYTLVDSIKDAQEYILNKIIKDNINHYNSWSNLKHLDPNVLNTKLIYIEEVLKDTKEMCKYSIFSLFYKAKDICTIMRMFNSCEPINCSYETIGEKNIWEINSQIKHLNE